MPAEYPDEFKQRIIRRYEKGESIKNLSQELKCVSKQRDMALAM